MTEISKEAREILDHWKDVSDEVHMGDVFGFAEKHGLTQLQVYEYFGIDSSKLEDARADLLASIQGE